ncbi:hypothetical protein B0J11DRAFT_619167 [Dendryphion nanum]|uniref:DUF7730 domain-containing protein n=1 Tax=Dendryphion nanum TaxID=256645 RepID=A0A9P9D6M1_9PLEO|nr:hypothetical protein B0J11DRAFT_619167 [Dendryphion nanum]
MSAQFDREIAKAIAAKKQPRQAVNESNRRALPHANPLRQQQSSLFQVLPLDCRLLIWEYVLQPSPTRIQRWRSRRNWVGFSLDYEYPEESDADCFPYRVTTAAAASPWIKKTEKRLKLLLCCRQLYLEGLSILYSTMFVFEMPLDLYSFQLYASPEGLSNVKGLIIAFGHINESSSGPFFSKHVTKCPNGSLDKWENAIYGLKRMRGLQELQIWLGHRHVQIPELERRPWEESQRNQTLEQKHHKLFKIFGTVDVANFTLHLTWNPVDLLSQREWPFRIKLHTKDELGGVIENELPAKSITPLYSWYHIP